MAGSLFGRLGPWSERAVTALMRSIHGSPWLYLLATLLVTLGLTWSASTLSLKSKLEDLLPTSAPSVQGMQTLKERIGSADSLVITLMTDDFDKVRPVLPEIGERLAKHPDMREVRWRQDLSIIDQNALTIFPSLPQLEEYYADLTETIKDAVKGELKLFDDDDPPGQAPAPGAPSSDAPKERYTWSWAELERNDALSRAGRRFREERARFKEYFHNAAYTTIGLQTFPRTPSSDLKFARRIVEEVEGTVRSIVEARLGPIGEGKVVTRVDIGGSYRSAIEEENSLRGNLLTSVWSSFALLALILVLAFRSVRVFFCVMVPLLCGTLWTAGLVGLTVGYLNMITAFIFAVLLGLGIDFGIHYYGRFREEQAAGKSPLDAMIITQVSAGEAVLNAQLTTTVAFFALALADFRGFSQFGLVAGMGLLLCHLAVVVVMPSVAFAFERVKPLSLMGFKVDRDAETGEIGRGRFALGGRFGWTVSIGLLAAMCITPAFIDFEYDFRKVSSRPKESSTYEKVQYGTTTATAPAVIFADDEAEARSYYDQLKAKVDAAPNGRHERIKDFQSLYGLVPTEQEAKIEVVQKLCRKLKRKVGLFEGDQLDGANELLSHCEPRVIGIADMPDWVKTQFTDKTGKVGEFIYVSPRGSVNDGEIALAFREEMLTLKGPDGKVPQISGKPMVWAEVLLQMKTDGQLITVAALIAVLLVLWFFERAWRPVLLVLLPLFTAFGLTMLVMTLLGMKLNFFNMLAAPTLIGLGVDGGTHLYHRYRELGPGSIPYILKNTGWNSFLVALTASMGYLSLLNSNHMGLESLGTLTLVAIASNLFTTFVLLPALLQWSEDRATRKAAAAST